jgi:hypothetical protein
MLIPGAGKLRIMVFGEALPPTTFSATFVGSSIRA